MLESQSGHKKRYTGFAALTAVLALLSAATGACAASRPVVMTQYGAVRGVAAQGVDVFKGIPFAAPPVGNLRWRAPEPPAKWTGVRNASEFGPSCMQQVHGDFLPWTMAFLVQNKVSENCLYLNVWTPHTSAKASLPVIVYSYGGAFEEGSGSVPVYNGANLARKGLVVVTFNYRLGAFGFLALPQLTAESPHHSSGNYALLDQIAALKWVRANIANFGGNPHRVTFWGQSAGAFSAHALLDSPLAKGLFERVMADSELSLSAPSPSGRPLPTLAEAEQQGLRFAAERHATTLAQLRALPAADLLPNSHAGPLGYAIIVDGWVVPRPPNASNREPGGNDVPIITGNEANDWMLSAPSIPSTEAYTAYVRNLYGPMAAEFEKLYPAQDLQEMQKTVAESSRDRDRVSMYLWATEREVHHKSPIYTYFFDRAIPWPQHPEFGAFHSGELPYFFENLQVLNRPWQPEDHQVSRIASGYLKAFASTGDPNAAGLPTWTAVSREHPATQQIGAKTGPMPLADTAKLHFWMKYFHSPESKRVPLF